MATKLTLSVGNKKTMKGLLMNLFFLLTDSSYKISTYKGMEANKNRLDHLLKLLKDEFFPEKV